MKEDFPSRPDSGDDASRTIKLIDLFVILASRKWIFIGGLFVISCAAVVYSLVATSYYTATTVILANHKQSGGSLGSLIGDLPIGGLLKGLDMQGEQENTRLLSILDSRRLADIIIQRHDLIRRYGFLEHHRKYYYESVLKDYHRNVLVVEDDNENIQISVTDSNPEFSALMANDIVSVLDSLAFELNSEAARGTRMFFENRLVLVQRNLDSAHHAFADFQTRNKFIDLDQQVKASIDAVAQIEGQRLAVDLEKKYLASSFGSNASLDELGKRRKIIENQLSEIMGKGTDGIVVPLNKAPELGIKYADLYRTVKIQETLYSLITQMYEQAKIQEANNAPAVTPLEKAIPPQQRIRPKRGMLCILAFFAGTVLMSLIILIQHWYAQQRSRNTPLFQKLGLLRQSILSR